MVPRGISRLALAARDRRDREPVMQSLAVHAEHPLRFLVSLGRAGMERWQRLLHTPRGTRNALACDAELAFTVRGAHSMYETTQAGGESAQRKFFRVTDNIPEETWYWLALGSIGVSAALKLTGKNDWSLFVGQWPPTFILFGLYHRLIHPSTKP